MAVDRRRALTDDLGVGKRRQRLGVELGHRRGRGGRCVGAAQHEGRAQHRLVAAAERPHGAQHGGIPDQRRVAVAIADRHRVAVDEIRPEQDGAHVQHVLGVPPGCGHAHEGLVGMLDRGIGDAQVPVRHRMVHGLDDVMGRGMQRRRHMRQLVEHGEVVEGRSAADVVQIAKIGRAGHRRENRRGCRPAGPTSPGSRACKVMSEGIEAISLRTMPRSRYTRSSRTSAPARLPVRERDRVAEDDARPPPGWTWRRRRSSRPAPASSVRPGQRTCQARQHVPARRGPQIPPGAAPAPSCVPRGMPHLAGPFVYSLCTIRRHRSDAKEIWTTLRLPSLADTRPVAATWVRCRSLHYLRTISNVK